MTYATWDALRNRSGDRQENRKRYIGFGENERYDNNNGYARYDRYNNYDRYDRYDRYDNAERGVPERSEREMRMPWTRDGDDDERKMRVYEPPIGKRRYRRYENGRFRPHKNSMNGGEYMSDDYEEDMEDDEEERGQSSRKNARVGGSLWMEPNDSNAIEPLTKEKAKEWVEEMTPPDPSSKPNGGKMTWEEVRAIASRHGVTEERKLVELYAMSNAMKSDYHKVAEKYGTMSNEYFYDLAKAFIDDEDAKLHKVARYYKYIAAR